MARKIDIREDMHNWSVRRKEQEKIRYNKGVKIRYFNPGNFVLLRDSTSYFRKLTERWRGLFLNDSFGGNHGALYILKILDRKSALNTHHNDHRKIFRPQERYLRPADKKPLKITQNLRFRRGKD